MENKKSKVNNFFSILKNLFILFIFLQFAPMIFSNLKEYFKEAVSPKVQIGNLIIKGMLDNSSFYVNKIQEFLKNKEIKGLLIKIDSPGGLPGTSQAIFQELKNFKKEKPVVVLVENICTSAAYYIAAASNKIITPPSALIGGIGVFLQIPNIKELLENWKIKIQFIQTGKYKTAGSPLKQLTPEEIKYLQKLSDDNYQQFIKDIALSRKIDIKKHKDWADGKVFLGNEAKKLNLVDQIGSYQNAIDNIKKLAKIDATKEIKLISPKKSPAIMRLFGGEEDYESSSNLSISSKIANFLNNIYINFLRKQSENSTISTFFTNV